MRVKLHWDNDNVNTLDVIGAATLESTLSVGGATTLSSTLGVVSDVSVGAVGARKLVVSDRMDPWQVQTNKFKVDGSTGNTVVAGTLNAGATTVNTLSSGAATLSSTLGVVSATDVSVGAVGARKLVVWDRMDLAIQTNKFKVDGDTGGTRWWGH